MDFSTHSHRSSFGGVTLIPLGEVCFLGTRYDKDDKHGRRMAGKNSEVNVVRTPCITVRNLRKNYGSLTAVKDISFSVDQGTIFGILGPNGAGKSTTIEVLLGLKNRDGGEVQILGLDPKNDGKALKTKLSAQLQSPALFDRLTVRELLELFGNFYPDPLSVEDAIAMVQLEEKREAYVDSLSGGQQHRLAVAAAIIANGDVLFLDEPTTGLDPQTRRNLWDTLVLLRQRGKTIVLTTHYMDEAERLCDRLVIVDQGSVVAEGVPKELIRTNFPGEVVEFSSPGFDEGEMDHLRGLAGVEERCLATANEVVLHSTDASATVAALKAFVVETGKDLADISLRRPTLDDLFLKITGRMINR